MANLYVGPSGSDTTGSGSSVNRWRNISYAIAQATAGDTIYAANGTYYGQCRVTKALTIEAEGGNVWVDGQDYTYPTGDAFPGGTNSYGTWLPANYDGLLRIDVSNVTCRGINTRYSRGRGVEVGLGAQRYPNVGRPSNCTIQDSTHHSNRHAGFVGDAYNNITLSNLEFYNSGIYAAFHRPTAGGQPGNHPAQISTKFVSGLTVTNVSSHDHWGEGFIPSMNTENFVIDYYSAWDCMSGLLYPHRCTNGVIKNFLIYHNDSGYSEAGSSRGSGLFFDNEDEKFYPGQGIETTIDNIDVYNGLIVGCEQGISIRSGDAGSFPFNDVKIHNITVVRPQATPASGAAQAIKIANSAVMTNIEISNCLFYIGNASGAVTDSGPSTPSGVTFRYNTWSRAPRSGWQGSSYTLQSDLQLIAPDTLITPGSINVGNYKLINGATQATTGLTISAVTVDYFGAARTAPYSRGFFEQDSNTVYTPGPNTLTLSTVNPTVDTGVTVTPTPSTATLSTVDPTVTLGGSVLYTPDPVTATLSTIDPGIAIGDGINFTPAPQTLTLSTINPWVVDRALVREALTLRPRSTAVTLRNLEPGEIAAERAGVERVEQGAGEWIKYVLSTANWTGTPTNATCALKRVKRDGTTVDISATNLTGNTSISTTNITTKVVSGLTAGKEYVLEVQFSFANRTEEIRLPIKCHGRSREIVQSPWTQGEDWRGRYVVKVGTWTTSILYPVCTLKQVKRNGDLVDVTTTKTSGNAGAYGQYIQTQEIFGLTPGKHYRLILSFFAGANLDLMECFADIYGRE